MKLIQLNIKKGNLPNAFVMVDDDDYDYLNQWNWSYCKRSVACYAVRMENKKLIYMHRQILQLSDSKTHVDHKDFNGLNNQRSNLRAVSQNQNNSHISPRKNTSSKYLGVHFNKRALKWVAQIGKGGRCQHLGQFENEIDAALAYNNAARKVHGEFANLNVVG